jgi:cobalt-zinc-cadmium efflux system membrane fusion protein
MRLNVTNRIAWIFAGLSVGILFLACQDSETGLGNSDAHGDKGEHEEAEAPKGPSGGRLLTSGNFELEIAIFEWGTPPEFRVWAKSRGRALAPADYTLEIRLIRLGGVVEHFSFRPQREFLTSNEIVAEPHSFEVEVEATHAEQKYEWHFESFEGRTRIAGDMAKDLGVATSVAGPAMLKDTVSVYGRVRTNPEQIRVIRARFGGVIRSVDAGIGDLVAKGDEILVVESDDSLNRYTITAPISGTVTQRDANPGEHTGARNLLTLTDTSSAWVDLSIFPADRKRVRVGNPVSIVPVMGGPEVAGVISLLDVSADEHNQSVIARVVLDDVLDEIGDNILPGAFVTAVVEVGKVEVPLAVMLTGIQSFRDFQVVYAQVGDLYEVRMLALGRRSGEFVEVLSGLEPGTVYVSENSHLIKADIEKSGASHDH